MEISKIKLTSWSEFKVRIISDLYPENHFVRGRFLFRGQASDSWALSSTFDRWYKGESKTKHAVAEKLLTNFIKECEFEDLPENVRNSNELMRSLAQHHGLPTRMLDWSESPYIAAFFAFSGHLKQGINLQKEIAIWALDTTSHIWHKENGCEILNVPSFGNERIKNQHGKFTYLRTAAESVEEYAVNFNEERALKKFTLPVSDVVAAMAELDSMGINFSRIYPGVTGNAMAAEVKVLLELKKR